MGILIIPTFVGFILFINRYGGAISNFLPNKNWRILLDHFITGFIVPLWLYIFFIGFFSFFCPNRKINYDVFLIFIGLTLIYFIILVIGWDGISQKFRDLDQIISEIIGIILSTLYFRYSRKLILKDTNSID